MKIHLDTFSIICNYTVLTANDIAEDVGDVFGDVKFRDVDFLDGARLRFRFTPVATSSSKSQSSPPDLLLLPTETTYYTPPVV